MEPLYFSGQCNFTYQFSIITHTQPHASYDVQDTFLEIMDVISETSGQTQISRKELIQNTFQKVSFKPKSSTMKFRKFAKEFCPYDFKENRKFDMLASE